MSFFIVGPLYESLVLVAKVDDIDNKTLSTMNSYIISLVVTAEQENAIIDLYTERCWAYLKTGEALST